jgi:hypothetical protein
LIFGIIIFLELPKYKCMVFTNQAVPQQNATQQGSGGELLKLRFL